MLFKALAEGRVEIDLRVSVSSGLLLLLLSNKLHIIELKGGTFDDTLCLAPIKLMNDWAFRFLSSLTLYLVPSVDSSGVNFIATGDTFIFLIDILASRSSGNYGTSGWAQTSTHSFFANEFV
jgi:hypothetical protein